MVSCPASAAPRLRSISARLPVPSGASLRRVSAWVRSSRSSTIVPGSAPAACSRLRMSSASLGLPPIAASNRSSTTARSARPSMSRTCSLVTAPAPRAIALIQQRQAVADRTVGGAGDQRDRIGFHRHAFGGSDPVEMLDQHLGIDPAQIETLAARQHGDRHLADFRRGKDELHMRRRLLQRLQQGVERLLRQHMHLVHDIDLESRRAGGIAHPVDQLSDIVDAGARGGVHLHHVDMAVGGDGDAVIAGAARRDGGAALAVRTQAVQRPGDDARGCRLAHPRARRSA